MDGVAKSTEKEKPYLIIAFTFWSVNCLVCFMNIMSVNSLFCFKRPQGIESAVLTVRPGGQLQLQLYKPSMPRWKPRSRIYIFNPLIHKGISFLEGHPFIIASVCDVTAAPSNNPDIDDPNTKIIKTSAEASLDGMSICLRRLDFLIRPRAGFTRHLYEEANLGRCPNLLLYGPFSPPNAVPHSHETIVLIGAGLGVS